MEAHKHTPEVRFAGFEGEWEERELGEIARKVTGKNAGRAVTDVFTNSAEHGVISQRDYFESVIAKSGNTDGYYVVEPGDLVYNPRISALAPVGPVNRNKTDRTGIVSPLYTVFRHDESVSRAFIEQYFKTELWHSFMRLAGNSGARSDRLSIGIKDFLSMPLQLPRFPEQAKVGSFFEALDLLIDLQRNKLTKLNQIKSAMLGKMFPKPGAKAPEVRFPGFEHEWEAHELTAVATFSKGSGYSKRDLVNRGTPIILYGRLYTKYESVISEVDTFAELKPGSKVSTGNEVIMPASGESSEDIARASAVVQSGVILAGDLNIIHPVESVRPHFLALHLSCGEPHSMLAERAQGKSVVHLHGKDFSGVSVRLPSLPEQTKIGEFFEHLDALIDLQVQKNKKLDQVKRSLLSKMFV